MVNVSRLLLVSLITLNANLCLADVLKIPIGSQGEAETAIAAPQRGMTMDTVRSRWGEPASSSPAVGEPPITRWEYPEFRVYFERSLVLHAALRHHDARAADLPQ